MRSGTKNKINYNINILSSLRVRPCFSYSVKSSHSNLFIQRKFNSWYGTVLIKTFFTFNSHTPLSSSSSSPSSFLILHLLPLLITSSFPSSLSNFKICFESKREPHTWGRQALRSPSELVPPRITTLEKARKEGSLLGDRLQTWELPSHWGAVPTVPTLKSSHT